MLDYVRRLHALDPAGSIVRSTPNAVMLLTGRSLYDDCHLIPQQLAFLERVVPPDVQAVPAHFPYHGDLMTSVLPEPNLLVCSWRNTLQYLYVRFVPSFRKVLARHLQEIFDRCERVVVITGSCGLAFLESSRPYLRLRGEDQLRVIALGPVIWFRPTTRNLTVIRGRHDWISRTFSPVAPDYTVAGGHMDYYASSHVAHLAREICKQHFVV
jgi:hypothetical protein